MSFTIPICEHIKTNGIRCGSPALSGENYCYAHRAHHPPHRKRVFEFSSADLPVLEDGTSIQVAVMNVLRGLLNGTLHRNKAGLLLYGLQIASSNLRRVDFEPEEFSTNPKPATPPTRHAVATGASDKNGAAKKAPEHSSAGATTTAPEVPNSPEDLAALARLINFAFPEEAPPPDRLLPSGTTEGAA